jgi:hypothetical protein
MANPNIVQVTQIYGNTAVQAVTTSATAIVTNNSGSGKVFKVNGIIVSNVDSSNSATLTVDLYRSATPYRLINSVTININTSYTPVDKTLSMYLLEGDSIRLTANANSRLEAIATWEEIN